jgi:hypothetical protein
MLPWFLRDPARLDRERLSLQQLASSVSWLVGFEWGISEGLHVDAIIRAHHHDYEVRVSFPPMYPHAPSIVRPVNTEGRLSSHQYGTDGPLCLQWGPDNWHSEITAAQMLESAYELFRIENPLGQERPDVTVVAPSRHSLTVGQELRDKWARWYISSGLRTFLNAQVTAQHGYFKFSFRDLGDFWGALVHEAGLLGATPWMDPAIPNGLPDAGADQRHSGVWLKTGLPSEVIKNARSLDNLRNVLTSEVSAQLLATDGTSPVEGFGRALSGVLLGDREERLHLLVVLPSGTAVYCAPVESDFGGADHRAPTAPVLRERSIGIVGLGAAGSKIAIALARMGVRRLVLVDHDVLMPENLRRHALDWQGVMHHKVDAVAKSIANVDPSVTVDPSRVHLSGQESNAVVNTVLARLAETDLIIDATANARVFNLLAAVSRVAVKPLVWLEIFGGGVGGLVARSRPGVDPGPLEMRAAYLQYCADNPAPASLLAAVDYSTEEQEGHVLVASDADVSIIAHHAVRFVSDSLTSPCQSIFPHSMYLVGMARAWIFEAPFATIPISTSWLPVAPADNATSNVGEETASFLMSLIAKAKT